MFKTKYQVFCNYDHNGNDFIGIVTLIRKNVDIIGSILGFKGRILGIKTKDTQIWNIYPPSGSNFKSQRETFFREELCNLMMNWKDHSKIIFQVGDHNCTHRLEDSINNPRDHLQPGLVAHLKVNGLKDGFLDANGGAAIEYSRISGRSSTRIDYIFSNEQCASFRYMDARMNFDHKVAIAEYNISWTAPNEEIPKHRFYYSWIIPQRLEKDIFFEKDVKVMLDKIADDLLEEETEVGEVDYSWYWETAKKMIIKVAKSRHKELEQSQKERIQILQLFYWGTLMRMENGENCKEEISKIKLELDEIYRERSANAIRKRKENMIDDHVYDIHKLQKERKYENEKKITEIKIDNVTYSGTVEVVEAIQRKMKEELKDFADVERDEPPNVEESIILNNIKEVSWTKEEKEVLEAPTTEEEISDILLSEVDLDSSPGYYGITYRFIKVFWKCKSYRKLYLKYLNYTRKKET